MTQIQFHGRRGLFAVALWCLLAAACGDDDDNQLPPPKYPVPEWNTFVPTPATGTPQEQIDRFVEANEIDTTVTASGLVYAIQDPGDGTMPSPNDDILVHYIGYLVDGTVFDASTSRLPLGADSRTGELVGRPIEGLIPAWVEGIPLLRESGRMWMLARPSVAYGNQGIPSRGIDASTVLVFEIELLEVVE